MALSPRDIALAAALSLTASFVGAAVFNLVDRIAFGIQCSRVHCQ